LSSFNLFKDSKRHAKASRYLKKLKKDYLISEKTLFMTKMSSAEQRKEREQNVRQQINRKLVETGEREKLKELLRFKLVECGWRDQLKQNCKEIVRKRGLENVTVDELVAEITPQGRQTVPDAVKKELLQRIRQFLAGQLRQA